MTGYGRSFGAVTVLNAILCGEGAAFGTELMTEAEFSLEGDGREVNILHDPDENDLMARVCVSRTLDHIGEEEPESWTLVTDSQIPISRGMKSSSSACNAIVSAVADEFGAELDPMEIVRLGVDCARASGVTFTGAFDDACGCHFGGLFVTNNNDDEVISCGDMDNVDVIFHVPENKIRKASAPHITEDIRKRGEGLAARAYEDPLSVLTENGRIVSALTGIDNSLSEKALECGALAAGITGFGPAIAIVLERGKTKSFLDEMCIQYYISTKNRRFSGENKVLRRRSEREDKRPSIEKPYSQSTVHLGPR